MTPEFRFLLKKDSKTTPYGIQVLWPNDADGSVLRETMRLVRELHETKRESPDAAFSAAISNLIDGMVEPRNDHQIANAAIDLMMTAGLPRLMVLVRPYRKTSQVEWYDLSLNNNAGLPFLCVFKLTVMDTPQQIRDVLAYEHRDGAKEN